MLGAQADPAQSVGFDLQDVHRTSEGKSFDYRVGVLPVLLSCTAQKIVHAPHVSFTRRSECIQPMSLNPCSESFAVLSAGSQSDVVQVD